MKYKVISSLSACSGDVFKCKDEKGGTHRINLRVSGDLPSEILSSEIIGRTFEIDELEPYITFGYGIKEVKD